MKSIQFISLTILAVLFVFSCSQTERKINSEKLQQRGDLYYAVNEEEPYTGKVIEKYDNGQKSTQRSYENGKLDGITTEWSSNGQKKKEVVYNNGIKNGSYKLWYHNGQNFKKGAYKDGKKSDTWHFWYKNGQKEKEGSFKNGIKNGKWKYWYKNGQKLNEGTYKLGIKDSKWETWYKDGQKAKEIVYNEGKKTGSWCFWNLDGNKLETGNTQDIDGNTYLTIKIGNQWWMAENLKVAHYRNGDELQKIEDRKAWVNSREGAYCIYKNDSTNVKSYGYLYNWHAVNDPRGIAPQGWHIPSFNEWKTLINYLGGDKFAGEKLTDIKYSEKKSKKSGFSALPSGFRMSNDQFIGEGRWARFWSSNPNKIFEIDYDDHRLEFEDNTWSYSVRCIKN